ncbi:hypothetical protein RhiirA4_466231 [Rhizophagus irregularis]|uniref:Uncharacterized protein n=1 Tax=Rhizophagus irregularis TaxID=588596 RepID=A0A2I1GTR0_9GLOM|nr:hypothetical protein RhiirA4_466231 [Rhizophagus irregularis]
MFIRNDFEVDIEKNKSISKLKEAINWLSRLEKAPVFDNFPQTNSSYEKSQINHKIASTKNPTCNKKSQIVEPPVSTATSSREQESLVELAITQQEVCDPESFKWTVNIEHVALEGFKDSILKNKQPVLEYDGAVLNMLKIGQSNQDLLRRMAIVLHHSGPVMRRS